MAKKKSTTTSTRTYSIAHPLAFWGIIIAGIAGFVTLVIKILIACNIITGAGSTVTTIVSIMNLVANLALFVSVFLLAYGYSKTKTKAWRILFWIFTVLAFLSLLGFNIFGMLGI